MMAIRSFLVKLGKEVEMIITVEKMIYRLEHLAKVIKSMDACKIKYLDEVDCGFLGRYLLHGGEAAHKNLEEEGGR
jgi:hypothetical protein